MPSCSAPPSDVELERSASAALILAALIYVLGVQAPTFRINIPLDNQLQRIDPGTMSETARRRARADFEQRWNQWNVFRPWARVSYRVCWSVLLLRV